jgi:hypothetical protein
MDICLTKKKWDQNKHSISDQFPDTIMVSQQIMQQEYNQTK